MVAVIQVCNQLSHLDLSYTSSLTFNTLDAIGTHLPLLTRLYLRVANKHDANGVTDLGISHIASGCPQLEVLNLFKCGFLTGVAAQALADNCPRLTHLDITEVRDFDSGGRLKALFEKCRDLEVLEATSVNPFSGRFLIDLSKKCTKLRHLCIDHQSSRNEELEAIADNCLNLAYFSAINIEGFNDIIARRFASSANTSLRTLRLGPAGRHPGLTKAGMDALRAAYPNLEITGGPTTPVKRRR